MPLPNFHPPFRLPGRTADPGGKAPPPETLRYGCEWSSAQSAPIWRPCLDSKSIKIAAFDDSDQEMGAKAPPPATGSPLRGPDNP